MSNARLKRLKQEWQGHIAKEDSMSYIVRPPQKNR
jgi:hypothetical protein